MIPLDIIYVNYNSTDCLIRSVETLFTCKHANCLNIVVVDNSSGDNPRRVKQLFPSIIFIQNTKNIGFGAAINQAFLYCHSEYIILLNPDTFVSNGFFEATIRFMDRNLQVGVMGPMIVDEDGSVQGSARAFPTPLTSIFGRNSPITKFFPNNSITRTNILTKQSDGTTPMEVDWVSGACMILRQQAMRSVDGFDERFFLYWEDADLCQRIKSNGWKVVYYPEATVTHLVGKSSNTRPVFANYQFHKSCYQLYEKYARWPFSILAPAAGIALMLRFIAAVILNMLRRVFHRILTLSNDHKPKKMLTDNRIRILRVISRMNIGGPSIHVKNLTERLNNDKIETRLITGTISPYEGDMNYITNFKKNVGIYLPELQREISPNRDFMALLKVIAEIHRFAPHIIHSHTSKAGTISRMAVLIYNIFQKRKIIAVHTFHGNVLDGYFNKVKSNIFLMIERYLAKKTDRIVAISKSQRHELLEIFKIGRKENIDTIKLGFDLSPFLNCSKQKGMLRNKLGVSDDTILVGIIGRMAPIKNHKMFLDSAKLLIGHNQTKDIKFILVGDGEERSFLEKYAADIELNEHVIFYGWEKDIPMIYADLDILALTSLNEGTPVSVIEAMAASVPVVTTGVGGIKDLLGSVEVDQPKRETFKICQRGILCPKDDPHTFSNALAYTIENGYRVDTDRSARARDYVVKNYSVERLVRDVEALYEKLTTTPRPIRNIL